MTVGRLQQLERLQRQCQQQQPSEAPPAVSMAMGQRPPHGFQSRAQKYRRVLAKVVGGDAMSNDNLGSNGDAQPWTEFTALVRREAGYGALACRCWGGGEGKCRWRC